MRLAQADDLDHRPSRGYGVVEEVGEGGDHVREGRVVLEVLHEGEDCKTEEGALMDVVSYLAGAFEASDPPHG